MNRIILIGNGFDIANGLETKYSDFIIWLWKKFNLEYNNQIMDSNDVFVIDDFVKYIPHTIPLSIEPIELIPHGSVFINYHQDRLLCNINYENIFLEKITENFTEKTWVDIEEEYFNSLKECLNKQYKGGIDKLNQDFDNIKIKLEEYFIFELERKNISNSIFSDYYQGFKIQDFSSEGKGIIRDKYFSNTNDEIIKFNRELKRLDSGITKSFDTQIYPENFLFLNFNYTNLPEKIISNIKKFTYNYDDWANKPIETISLHGKLKDSKNPIIFGYGDEADEDHKLIEKKGGNFLDNIKTINYLKTQNYKNLLSYIESDYYQVFIFGHSCGLSDKTLLNTLFEHKHCVSIKPFYYEYEKETKQNNYNDIVKNIYRVFSNKTTMRDKVVPETYCQALEQITK